MVAPLQCIAVIVMGQSPASSTYNSGGEGLPFFQGKAEFTELHPVVEKWCTSPAKIAQPGDILVSVRAPVGATNIANCECCIGRGLAAIRYPQCSMYLFYYLRLIARKLDEQGTGTTFRAISGEVLRQTPIPLPPLAEQHRIVAKIEELFSRLDKGIEALKTAQAQLKTYRQAVLKWAFEGRLTNEDVTEGELPEGWQIKKISEISSVVRGGSPRPAGDLRFYVGTIPFLKVADLTKDNKVYLYDHEYTIKEAGLSKTRRIEPNTLLLTNSGATLGVPKICMINATMNDGIAAFLGLDARSIKYVFYFWKSKTKELRNINQGAAQPNLNTEIIKNYDIPICSFEEQSRIVSEIESRFSVCDKLEESITSGLAQAEALRQSILKRAFEGRLLSDQELAACRAEPDWEPAEKLLERIRAERAAAEQARPAHAKRSSKPGAAPAAKPAASDNKSVRAARGVRLGTTTAATSAAVADTKTGGAKGAGVSTKPVTPARSRAKTKL